MKTEIDWLCIQATPEEDLKLEIEARQILNSDDHKQVAEFCANLHRQNWAKDQIIKNCLGRIGDLEANNIKRELDKEKEGFWFMKWFS